MELDKVIDKVFHSKQFKIEPMNKGLTNHNYKLFVNDNIYVLRIPRSDSSQVVNRKHEEEAILYSKDLNIDIENIYFDVESGYKITKYIDGLYEFQECPYQDKIEKVARLMKKLHAKHQTISYDFNPIARYQQYVSHIKKMLYPLENFHNILNEITKFNHYKIFCHNDWVSGNILFDKEHTYLIDYEYGANNHPYFDVMSFITENQITDENERKRFYDIYFGEEIPYHDLTIWENFHNLLWCAWANMMYDSRQEEIYMIIAKEKYDALCTSYQKL